MTATTDTAYDDARIIGKGIRLGGAPQIVAALEAALAEGPLTPDQIERLAHPDWDRLTFEEQQSEPVSEGAEAVGLAHVYAPVAPDPAQPWRVVSGWLVAASWWGWLPASFATRDAALLAYGYVLGGEGRGPLEELRNRVNRRERRPIETGDVIVYAEYDAPDA